MDLQEPIIGAGTGRESRNPHTNGCHGTLFSDIYESLHGRDFKGCSSICVQLRVTSETGQLESIHR